MTRLPDFVVLGQGKAGTSLIYRVLEKNPDVGLSKVKELLYFGKKNGKSAEWYASQFDHLPPGIARVGEVSPAYLDADPIQEIHDVLGLERCIRVLLHAYTDRSPTDLRHVYLHRARQLRTDLPE